MSIGCEMKKSLITNNKNNYNKKNNVVSDWGPVSGCKNNYRFIY